MKSMNIAASSELVSRLSSHRRVVALGDTDFTDVAAVVITAADSRSGILALLKRTGFHLPVFLYSEHAVELPAGVTAVINGNEQQWLELESAACQYEENLLPPFYDTLTQYVEMGNSTFACPGHQHGAFFKKHPAGRHFYDFFGENVFRADMCNADVKLGDLLIHEGSAKDAQKFAAKVFHADKTYFVLNGTSAANKVVTNALLTRGDLVLFDRNNHKSNHHGALIQAGATPVYLEASRNPFGFIGGDVNAKIHEGESGRRLWAECVEIGIEARKAILARCKLFRPFIPPVVDGKLWQDYPTSVLASDRRFFSFEPGAKWHGFEGYAADQYFVDPCKLLLTTPGIDAETGEYSDFGVPATILAHYLRENGIVPEKCDLNSILFLLTPAESHEKLAQLVAMLAQFEQHIEDDSPLVEVLPSVYNKYPVRYRDYTLRQLCQEMHDLYVSFDVKDLQKAMFRQQSFPSVVMNPQDAHSAYIRGDVELVRIRDAEGRIAAEGALPYPPGVLCVVPGEVWGGAVQRYFLALEEGVNLLPGFSPELQGVYSETDADGVKRLYGYVLK
ncbi:TPA: ornithine decarboxylase [Escherichia coli]|nr:ornithine decarboxylase [Escherichia coli]